MGLSHGDDGRSDHFRGCARGCVNLQYRDRCDQGRGRGPGHLRLLRITQRRRADFTGRGFQVERRCLVYALQRVLIRDDAGYGCIAITRTTPPAAATATT